MSETTITPTEVNAITTNAPDSTLLREMLNGIDECKEIQVRVQMIIECFTYLTQFPDFFQRNTEVAYSLRTRAKTMEVSASELVATEQIDFDQAATLVQVTNQLLDITSYLAEFDYEEEILPVPHGTHDYDYDDDEEGKDEDSDNEEHIEDY